jgi:hypothetical protein
LKSPKLFDEIVHLSLFPLTSQGAFPKVAPLLSKIVVHIRTALRSTNLDIYKAGLDAIEQLSKCVGPELNPHLSPILVALHQKWNDKGLGPRVQEIVAVLDANGGDKATALIKSKIPTYAS